MADVHVLFFEGALHACVMSRNQGIKILLHQMFFLFSKVGVPSMSSSPPSPSSNWLFLLWPSSQDKLLYLAFIWPPGNPVEIKYKTSCEVHFSWLVLVAEHAFKQLKRQKSHLKRPPSPHIVFKCIQLKRQNLTWKGLPLPIVPPRSWHQPVAIPTIL